MSELETVRIRKCLDWKLLETALFGKCHNKKVSEFAYIGMCQKLNFDTFHSPISEGFAGISALFSHSYQSIFYL